jgi:HlyD family secretion protein
MTGVHSAAHSSIRRHLSAGLAVLLLVAGGVGSWAATTDISGAVIASGVVVVDTSVKKVQHPKGGVVGEILAHDGDAVKAGDVVVRLDDTITRSNLTIVTNRLIELTARKARLEAERDAQAAITIPAELSGQQDDPKVTHVISGEQRLFKIRKSTRAGQEAQLRQRIEQIKQEITGLEAQAKAKGEEIILIQRELKGARGLWDKKLMPISRLTAIEREATRVSGEKAKLMSEIARAGAQVSETELQIIQIERKLASEVGKELGDIDASISEFVERKVAAQDELNRIEIRAPQDGIVHQSIAHTVGGVITGGEAIMLIVPKSDDLKVEAKVSPTDVDQMHIGQTARLLFSAFNQRTTPEISGSVARISADITTDERTGASYYTVRMTISQDERARLGKVSLVPGMPVEVFIKTGDRRVLSYLVKPLTDQITRAFREQ